MRFGRALFVFVGLASILGLGAFPRQALARGSGTVYLDVLSAEAVGQLRPQTFDVYRRSGDNETFVGNQDLVGHNFLGGGFGLRIVYGMKNGMRISGEGSASGGRLVGGEMPWGSTSTAIRGELLGGIGYQALLGPLVLHGAAILGMDYLSFKANNEAPSTDMLSSPLLTAASSGEPIDYRVERWGLRLGLQAGAHLQVAKSLALYSDVTFDYDGQWRARFGFAVGSARP